MKLLITGSDGQLGNELVSAIKNGKCEIGKISEVYRDAEIVAADITTLDITDINAVFSVLEAQSFDVIINCAAMTNVDACETDCETAYLVNATGVKNLALAASQTGAKLVHISTDYVFSGDGDKPYDEWDTVSPQSVYGKSKALGEQYALKLCEKCFVVRTSWLYGYVGGNFVKTVRRVMKEKGAMSVVNDQRGNPTHANDLAYHILKLALTEKYGIYHCTGNGECSWYEFACEIAHLSGCKGKITPCTSQEYKTLAKRPKLSSLNHSALSRTVGDEMRFWKDALAEYIQKVDD